MLLALIGDSHFDQHSRFAECVRIHEWIRADMAARKVDAVLHSGDVYERKSTPLEREAVAHWVQGCAEFAPVVFVRGNHDAIDDLPLLERLESRFPIRVCERSDVLRLDVGPRGLAIAMLGWPQRAYIHALAAEASKEGVEQVAADALRAVLRGLGDWLERQDCPRFFLGHVMMRGSRVSTGQPLVGCDFELGLEDLALARADFYGLGHIHMGEGNEWKIGEAPALFPGSPRRSNYGEVEAKGYVLIEFDDVTGQLVSWQRIETPCTPMVHLEARFDGERFEPVEGPFGDLAEAEREGAEVRFRYRVANDQREAAARVAEELLRDLLAAGAADVKVEEEVERTTRSRSLEIAQAVTLEEKLDALWRARGFDPGERRAELIDKAHQVEEEVRSAA